MIVSRDEKNAILNVFLNKLESQNKLKEEYGGKPIQWLAKRGSYYPPILEKMFLDIYFGRVRRAALVGPRGGGKTFTLGDIASAMFLFKGFDGLIGSGSEKQAAQVYERVWQLLGEGEEMEEYVPDITTRLTRGKDGNWIEFVPASQRRVRGPHPGEGKRGGLIIIDEEAEMAEDIFKAFIGTGGTAKPLVIIRASTSHKVEGTFADLVDNPKRYTVYRWDCFDVCGKCDRKCEECIEEFREEYCRGKAKTNSVLGWMSIDTIFDFWFEMDKEWFEVEMMGLRPSGAGLVIDPQHWPRALVEEVQFVRGAPNAVGIDWGFVGLAAAVATQLVPSTGIEIGYTLQIFDRMSWTRKGTDDIIADLNAWKGMYGTTDIYADSSHPFENDALRKAGFTVTEVTFVSFKEAGAGAIRGAFEKGEIEIPKQFEARGEKKQDLINQLKRWKKGKDGKIVKKDDHFCDALLCTMQKWWKKMRRKAGFVRIVKRRAEGRSQKAEVKNG